VRKKNRKFVRFANCCVEWKSVWIGSKKKIKVLLQCNFRESVCVWMLTYISSSTALTKCDVLN